MEWSCVNAASLNPETVNPRNDFNTWPKMRGNVTENHLQNAKPEQKQWIAWSAIGLGRACVYTPSWTSVEMTIAPVIQMFLLLTGGGQGSRCGNKTRLTPPNAYGKTP